MLAVIVAVCVFAGMCFLFVFLKFSGLVLVWCEYCVLTDENYAAQFRNDIGHGVYMQNTDFQLYVKTMFYLLNMYLFIL
jgi:hypothetical protein